MPDRPGQLVTQAILEESVDFQHLVQINAGFDAGVLAKMQQALGRQVPRRVLRERRASDPADGAIESISAQAGATVRVIRLDSLGL